MELKGGDLSKILIFAFIIIVGLVGTYLEFRKPKKSDNEKEIDKNRLNKIIIDSLKEEEEKREKNENSNI